MKATIVDLRYRTKDVLKAVERGEEVTILSRGKEKARIVPIEEGHGAKSADSHEAFGMWKDRDDLADVAGYVRRLRQGRVGDL